MLENTVIVRTFKVKSSRICVIVCCFTLVCVVFGFLFGVFGHGFVLGVLNPTFF